MTNIIFSVFGENSDVQITMEEQEELITCKWCSLGEKIEDIKLNQKDMIKHLKEHRGVGQLIPFDLESKISRFFEPSDW